MRLALPGGQYADLRDKLNYGAARRVRAALMAAKRDPLLSGDIEPTILSAYLEAWHVLDENGAEVPITDFDSAPDDVVREVVSAATDLWNGKAEDDPKDGAESLPSTPQAQS